MTKQSRHRESLLIVSIALLLGMTLSFGQARASVTQSTDRPPSASSTSSRIESGSLEVGPDYRIGVGDVVEVRVDKAPELSGMYRVSSTGTFQMYFLGLIIAQNKSTEELRSMIAEGLRGRYLKSPNVVVEVKQNSRKVFVQGAVRTPGAYQLDGSVSLLKLISLCGGLAENHGSSAFIFREARSNQPSVRASGLNGPAAVKEQTSTEREPIAPPDYVFTPVSIAGLLRGNLSENVLIEPYDIVNIPPADLFFVAGEVRAPGSFPLKPGTTLRQAITLAQGTTIQAATGRAMIFREDPSTGKRVDMKVDVAAVMAGKKGAEDLLIMANDVILIPNSKLKSVGATLLRSLGFSVNQVIPRF